MKVSLALVGLLLAVQAHAMDKMPLTEADAWKYVVSGHCQSSTSLPGTGITKAGGWIEHPSIGMTEICTVGDGVIETQGRPAAHCVSIDMLGGKPVFIKVMSTEPRALEWKVPGYMRGRVPVGFQFPPVTGSQ